MGDIVFKLEPEIIIGQDTINRAGILCRQRGARAIVAVEPALYGNKTIERLLTALEDAGVEAIVFDEIQAQAAGDAAETLAEILRGSRASMIIGLGGLRTQSIARLAGILANSRLTVCDLLDGREPETDPKPFLSIPTAWEDPFMFAGSFIGIDPRDRSVKLIKSPPGLCAGVIIDPGLSESPGSAFASAALFDGFCTAVEAYCSSKAGFLSDALLEQAIALYGRLMHAPGDSGGFPLSEGAANAAFLMALGAAVSAPGAGTALAYAISAKFPAAKSRCAAALLPRILEKLVAARPEKMAKAAGLIGESAAGASVAEAAALGVEAVKRRMAAPGAPANLRELGLSLDRMLPAAESARNLAFVAFSPWTVTTEEAYGILKDAF